MPQDLIERSPDVAAEQIAGLKESINQLMTEAAGPVAVECREESGSLVFSAPVSFPGGVGQGRLHVEAFRYRGNVRVDVRLNHNRVFARADGSPTRRPLYLNDFVASATLTADQPELPVAFHRRVVRGVRQARSAVRRHNVTLVAHWLEILVAVAA